MEKIKVVTLDDWSHIICRIVELRDSEENPVCFLVKYPFSLDNYYDEESQQTNIRFGPWNIYTQDTEIRIPFGAVRTVTNPKDFIREKYIEFLTPFDPMAAERLTKDTDLELEELTETEIVE